MLGLGSPYFCTVEKFASDLYFEFKTPITKKLQFSFVFNFFRM
jgi:hypothetical protein